MSNWLSISIITCYKLEFVQLRTKNFHNIARKTLKIATYSKGRLNNALSYYFKHS